jgi:dipeptidyl aminopeptidase/acylaminoacyl peptidase
MPARALAAFPFLTAFLVVQQGFAQQPAGWQSPPEPIASLVVAEPAPDASLSPCRRFLLFSHREALPGIDVLSRPYEKMAGSRIDLKTRGPQLSTRMTKVVLRTIADGTERELALPPGHVGGPFWSADGERIAFTRAGAGGLELWVAATGSGAVAKLDVTLDAALGAPLHWLRDQRTLLCKLAVPGAPPAENPVPEGPVAQETEAGVKAQVRTNQDMLQSERDCRWFEYLSTSQLARVAVDTGAVEKLGAPGLIAAVEASPDGEFVLATVLHRPFSYLVPWNAFPHRVEVLGRDGAVVKVVADLPLREDVPIGGVPTGPRGVEWLPTQPHALCWTEALDGGDPKAKADKRDNVLVLTDLTGAPRPWTSVQFRAQGLSFGRDGSLALLHESDRDTRTQRVSRLDAADFGKASVELYSRSAQDVYGDPGATVNELSPTGVATMRQRGALLFRAGQGQSKDGSRPFLDSWDPLAGKKERLWQCAEGRFETFVGFLDDARILIRSESPQEPPQMYEVALATGARRKLTDFRDPAQEFAGRIEKRLLRYQRQDGVALSGTLYLPPGHREGEHHPVLVWAYPQEFTQASDAGQVRSAPTRYTRFAGISHLWLLLAGYAVLDDAAMPIVGPVRTANDTFVAQLQQNADAAVQALLAQNVADPWRIAVGGHSYGAFMTANLLCHTDLFAAGIARSGAYNRTLTPFGFQNEERTYWEAPEIYQAMSPFAHADRIKAPLLLIHGEDDDNQGTWPIQSQRLFAAIKGHGGTARLVLLPHEAHGYRGRETTLQCLAEMVNWLDRYVKNRAQSPADASGAASKR